MSLIDIRERLTQHRDELRRLGVERLALYGSVARDEAREDSDVDIVVDTADGKALGLFRLARVSEALERILGRRIDVVSQRGVDHAPRFKKRIAADLVNVF